MISPARSLNSPYWRSRSASRTFWEDNLLGRLRLDAAELDRRQRIDDEVADRGTLLELLGIGGRDLGEVVLHLVHDLDDAPQAEIARLGVDLGADVVLGAVARLGGALDRVLHRLDHDLAIDQLLAGDRVGDGEEFGAVGGNGGGHGIKPP